MKLSVLGLSHHTAPVEIRERIAFGRSETSALLHQIQDRLGITEAVMLSTCNRTELYVHPVGSDGLITKVREVLVAHAAPGQRPLTDFLYHRDGEDAVRHLLRVTAGLDAMVVGEAEIQGQVREAYRLSAEGQTGPSFAGPVLHRLFQTALAAGGRVRAETSLGTGTGSVAIVAVQLAKKIFGSLRGREVLVVGAGETGELVVDALAREGVRGAVVANRSYDRAADLAERIEGRALRMAGLTKALATSDLVLSSTAAPHQVITTTTLAEAMPDGVRRPLLMIDLAIPRDIEPAVGEEPNVFLYNVDDLRQIVDDNLSQRKQAVPLAERIVDEMTAEFRSWYASQEAVPLIRSLREQSDRIRRDELDRLLSRLTDLTDEQRSHLEDFSRRLLNKWLHRPTARLRQGAEATGMEALVHAARILYGLDDDTGEPESSPLPVRSNDPPS